MSSSEHSNTIASVIKMRYENVWYETDSCTAENKTVLTFPKLPFPNTIKKLKSVALITSLLPILWGRSLSEVNGFLDTDVF